MKKNFSSTVLLKSLAPTVFSRTNKPIMTSTYKENVTETTEYLEPMQHRGITSDFQVICNKFCCLVRNFNYNKFNHYERLKNKNDLDAFRNPNAKNNDNNNEYKISEEIKSLNAKKRFDIDCLEKQKFTGKDKNYFKKIS